LLVLACGDAVYGMAAPREVMPRARALATDRARAMRRLERVRRRFLGALVHGAGALRSTGTARRPRRGA
jgi:hypothetical protein